MQEGAQQQQQSQYSEDSGEQQQHQKAQSRNSSRRCRMRLSQRGQNRLHRRWTGAALLPSHCRHAAQERGFS